MKKIYKTVFGFTLLPERRKLLTSQEEDHVKVLKGEIKDIEYYKKWENYKEI
jgi:hypothetical protein